MSEHQRDYDAIAANLAAGGSREQRMQAVADALWKALRERGVSWVGFYLDHPAAPDDVRLVLGPHRDKPACSPIGLHGVCGQTLRFRTARIVDDVRDLGEDYIACDPLDRSEITVPMIDSLDECWGVLDLDSQDIGAFGPADEVGLRRVLQAAEL